MVSTVLASSNASESQREATLTGTLLFCFDQVIPEHHRLTQEHSLSGACRSETTNTKEGVLDPMLVWVRVKQTS